MAGVPVRRVAIIGAGPSGAIATDALVKEGVFDVIRVFDRKGKIGGSWIFDPNVKPEIKNLEALLDGKADAAIAVPPVLPATTAKSEAVNGPTHRFYDTGMFEHLHTNIGVGIMGYTQEPIPEILSEQTRRQYGPNSPYRHREVVLDWVVDIFTRDGNDGLVELNTTVERAEKLGGEWVFKLRKEGPNCDEWWEERFDAVVVASGHYNVPSMPNIPGLVEYDKRFPGRIIHSKHFRNVEKFRNKRVVIVGGSVSASELLHEVLPVAQNPVYASLRNGPVDLLGWTPWQHPYVSIKKQIIQFDPAADRLDFEDGSSLDDVDYVIFATGYQFSLPFLPTMQERIPVSGARLPSVYMHTWDIDDPTLTFMGMVGGGFTFLVYEWQAVAIARHLAGRAKPLPSTAEQRQWERDRLASHGSGRMYWSMAPDPVGYFNSLRDIAGDPAPGTRGRTLVPFQAEWLDEWKKMLKFKAGFWERARKLAIEEQEREGTRPAWSKEGSTFENPATPVGIAKVVPGIKS